MTPKINVTNLYNKKGYPKAVLTLIVSKDLNLRFLSSDATASFRPHPAHLDQPIEAAEGLMAVDPGLSLDCRSVLRGGPALVRKISSPGGGGFLRQIMLRTASNGQADELIVNYEPSVSAQRLELIELRKHLADVLYSVQDSFAYYDKYDCLVHFNQAYARLHGSSEGEIIAGMRFEEILRRDLRNGLIDVPVEQHEQWLRDSLAQRERQVLEEEMRFSDGRWFRVTVRATSGGAHVHIFVDITGPKTAQIALQQVISGAWTGRPLSLSGSRDGVRWCIRMMLPQPRQAFCNAQMVQPPRSRSSIACVIDLVTGFG